VSQVKKIMSRKLPLETNPPTPEQALLLCSGCTDLVVVLCKFKCQSRKSVGAVNAGVIDNAQCCKNLQG
jgi:hypothetical protein